MTPVALQPARSSRGKSSPVSMRQVHLAEVALAVGGFAIGTGEFGIMGLLPDVANDIGVSIPVAGHVIRAYALRVVIRAPVISVLAARPSPRTFLLSLMSGFSAGHVARAPPPPY